MKKVLFLGRFPPPVHGASAMNESYYEALSEDRKFEVRKIKINYSDSLNEVGKTNLKKFFGMFAVFFKTLKHLVIYNPDKVYFEIAPKGIAFYRDGVYALLCKAFGKEIVFHLHAKGVSRGAKGKISKSYYKFVFRNSKVILLSNSLYEDVREVIDKKQVKIVPNGIKDRLTEEKFKKIIEKRNKNKKLQLLFLSNMIESKGPIDVLKICKELNEKNINFECKFVGKFQENEFEQRFFEKVKEFGLEKKCKYLGAKYGKEKERILEKTDYLVFPTQYPEETFGLVIIEAFMYCIPALSYDNASIKETINNENLGNVVKQGKWKKLSQKLIKRIDKKENPKKIRKEFKENYQLKKSVDKLKNILSK